MCQRCEYFLGDYHLQCRRSPQETLTTVNLEQPRRRALGLRVAGGLPVLSQVGAYVSQAPRTKPASALALGLLDSSQGTWRQAGIWRGERAHEWKRIMEPGTNTLRAPGADTARSIRHMRRLLCSFDSAMLVARRPNGAVLGCSLLLAGVESDLTVWLASHGNAIGLEGKTHEGATLILRRGSRNASLKGRADVVLDPERLQRLWEDSLSAYSHDRSPEGELLRFTPSDVEFWDDAPGGGVNYVFHTLNAAPRAQRADRALSLVPAAKTTLGHLRNSLEGA